MPDFRKLVARIGTDLGGLDKGLQDANAKLDKFQHEQQAKYGALANGLKSTGMAMSAALTAPLLFAAKQSFDAYVQMDSLKRGLTAVMGSATSASTEMSKLREVAKLPGLGVEEAIQGSVNLQAAGMSADLARNALMGFGNALATVGKGKAELDGVQLALSQIMSKGKVSAEEINQIAERVPQIRQIMKSAFGTADTEALQKMGISSEKFVAKITEELLKIPRVTGGIKNDMENMSDAVKLAMSDVGKAIAPTMSSIAIHVSNAANAFTDMSDAQKSVVVGVAGIAAGIGPLGSLIGYYMDGAAKIKLFGSAAKSAYDTVVLKAMYAADGVKAFAKTLQTDGVSGVRAMMNANGGLRSSFNAMIGTGGAIALAAVGIAAFAMSVKNTHEDIARMTQDMNENADAAARAAGAMESYSKALKKRTDTQLRDELRRVMQEKSQAVVQRDAADKNRGKWWTGFKATDAEYDYGDSAGLVKYYEKREKVLREAISGRGYESAFGTEKAKKTVSGKASSGGSQKHKKSASSDDYSPSYKASPVIIPVSVDMPTSSEMADYVASGSQKAVESAEQTAERQRQAWDKSLSVMASETSAHWERIALEAEKAGDKQAAAVARAKQSMVGDYVEIARAIANGESTVSERTQLMWDKYRDAIDRKPKDSTDMASSINSEAMNERQAAQELKAMQYDSSGDIVGAAETRARAELMNTVSELNELKRQGIDVTQRATLAQEKYNKAVEGAEQSAAKTEAEAVQSKIASIRDESKERERAHNDEMNRRKSAIGFTTWEDDARSSIKAGFTSRFRTMEPGRDTATPPSSNEVAMALRAILQEQQLANRMNNELIRAISSLRGQAKTM